MFFKKENHKKILILIIFVATVLRLFRLDFPPKFVFDEVYHAFTAQEYLKGSKEAWEWWTTPPPSVAYEWTHPPLAKEIMATSMFILNSKQSFAWRLPEALLGVFSIFLVYLISKKLLKNEVASLLSAFVFSIDGLNFVQSRVGMNDIYFITFVLLSFYLFLEKKLFLSAVVLGLAISSKWASLYTYIIYIPILLKQRNFKNLILFFLIPPIVYMISYIPFFLLGHGFDQFIGLQKQMWWYHTNLKAHHDYASAAWSWPLNLYPVWYFVDYRGDKVANIFASGNPVVFLAGSISIILIIWEVVKKKSINLFILILGFFAFWLPWFSSPRIMFLYHFAPSVPFLCIALGYQLEKNLHYQNIKNKIFILIILMIISFILLFPFLTGIHLPRNLMQLFFLTNLAKNPF